MLIYIALSAIIIKQIYIFLYPIEYEIIVNAIENKMNKLKKELESQIMSLGYNLLYYYSVAQIYVNKIITFVSPHISVLWITLINFLKENKLIDKEKKVSVIGIYKDGKIINQIIINKNNCILLNTIEESVNNDNYDFIMVTDKKDDCDQINKIHYTKIPQSLDDYKQSNIRFFAVELTYKNEKYSIDLINENGNHYIVNNVLNKEFFNYYLTNILKIEIDKNNFDYKVFLIDHNVNMVELTVNDYLVIKEDEYEIKKINDKLENMIINDDMNEELEEELELELELEEESDKSDDYVKLDKDH